MHYFVKYDSPHILNKLVWRDTKGFENIVKEISF
jgi:hypothetical protein